MARRLSRAAMAPVLVLAAGAVALAGTRSLAPGPAAGAVTADVPASLPWWKKSLSHTVQEEWVFAQHMDQRFGPRWRTALPDKVVAGLYASWLQEGVTPGD